MMKKESYTDYKPNYIIMYIFEISFKTSYTIK